METGITRTISSEFRSTESGGPRHTLRVVIGTRRPNYATNLRRVAHGCSPAGCPRRLDRVSFERAICEGELVVGYRAVQESILPVLFHRHLLRTCQSPVSSTASRPSSTERQRTTREASCARASRHASGTSTNWHLSSVTSSITT